MRWMRLVPILAAAASLTALAMVALLEMAAAPGLQVRDEALAGSPATIYQDASDPGPLVLVAHGYGGSRQMMRPLSLALARAGFTVAAFDFHGHGRHRVPMDADVTSIEGTTAQLVEQTVAVGAAARAATGVDGPLALLGHSMATDVVIRAAPAMGAAAVVAISMYSEAVTPEAPARLLIVSGAREGRLREVALGALRQVGPDAAEGETARAGDAVRRVVAAPGVGHVGVLYSAATMREAASWIAAATEAGDPGAPLPRDAPWTALLLAAVIALAWPAARLAGTAGPVRRAPLPRRTAALAVLGPAVTAVAAAALLPDGALGLAAFGPLAAFLGVWGAAQSAILWRAGRRLPSPGWRAGAIWLGWAVVFAAALDRYGASFAPSGPRAGVMALMALGTVPFLAGDALLARGSGIALRIAARAAALAALLGAMLLAPRLGVAFTVLPVAVLFWLVFGLAARPFAAAAGAAMPLALAIALAWAIASSTPLIAAGA